jgi:hypothetical protein
MVAHGMSAATACVKNNVHLMLLALDASSLTLAVKEGMVLLVGRCERRGQLL